MHACEGILIEDQVAPKSCGHVRDKQVVGQDEAVARIQAAVDAREEGSDILIVARTDARQVRPGRLNLYIIICIFGLNCWVRNRIFQYCGAHCAASVQQSEGVEGTATSHLTS